ncbi:MAG: glycosyltransferase family 1 protein [Rikenellaceae bacterium]
MRILQVFGKLDRGGAETMIMNYYRNIDREQIQFDFVVNFKEEGAYEAEIKLLGGEIFRLPRFRGYNVISFLYAWFCFLKANNYWDIIHIHNFKIAGLVFPIAKMLGVKRRIVHMHIANAKYSPLRRIGYNVTKWLVNLSATERLACSEDAGKCYFGRREFIVVNNAIDAQKFIFNTDIRTEKRAEFDINDKFVVGHIGRFSEQKNHPFIIDIFKRIHNRNNNSVLMLVGIGSPIKEQMERRVIEVNLRDSVIFTGARADVHELMQAMDVFLFPSLYEGLGIVAIEAQAAGLPTIVSNEVPDAAMITGLVEKISLNESAGYWAEALLKHNNGYSRRNMYDEVRKAGYDIHDNVKWLENLYYNE